MTLNEAKRLLKKNGYLLEDANEDIPVEEYDEQQKSAYGFLHNECGLDWKLKNTDTSYIKWPDIIYVTTLNDGTPIRIFIDALDGWVDAVRVGDEKTITANEFIKRCKA